MNKRCRFCERMALDGHDYCTVHLSLNSAFQGSIEETLHYGSLAIDKDTSILNEGYHLSEKVGNAVEKITQSKDFGQIVETTGKAMTNVHAHVVQVGKNVANVAKEGFSFVKSLFV